MAVLSVGLFLVILGALLLVTSVRVKQLRRTHPGDGLDPLPQRDHAMRVGELRAATFARLAPATRTGGVVGLVVGFVLIIIAVVS